MKSFVITVACLALLLFALASCGEARCRAGEAARCANNYTSYTSACGGDATCNAKCTETYCNCLHDEGCDKAGNCK